MKKILIFVLIVLFVYAPKSFCDEFKRIISLAPSITESIYYLGKEEQLIAVTSYCNHPEEAKKKEIIGGLLNPNLEKIYSLAPDLVLASTGINQLQTVEKLRSLKLNVVALNEGNNLDEIIEIFLQVGRLLSCEDQAVKINQKVQKRINSIRDMFKTPTPKKIFWQVGANPLVTIGSNSFVNDFIEYTGGINIFKISSIKYPRVSREEVLRKNPEIIILIPMGNLSKKEIDTWKSFKQIDAVKNNNIYLVDGDKLCRPTPLSFLSGLEEIVKIVHPEIVSLRE